MRSRREAAREGFGGSDGTAGTGVSADLDVDACEVAFASDAAFTGETSARVADLVLCVLCWDLCVCKTDGTACGSNIDAARAAGGATAVGNKMSGNEAASTANGLRTDAVACGMVRISAVCSLWAALRDGARSRCVQSDDVPRGVVLPAACGKAERDTGVDAMKATSIPEVGR